MSNEIIIDAHQDLAWNILTFGRDYTLSAAETRQREVGTNAPQANGETLLGWPNYQQARVAVVFSTLFAAPIRDKLGEWDRQCYSSAEEAHHLYKMQLNVYER